ncbi:MAG: hypothetical protein H6Q86_5739 [candidate division NC10 bacterium]|nr:hypothetical protein [candidate division NC10 bacterium]
MRDRILHLAPVHRHEQLGQEEQDESGEAEVEAGADSGVTDGPRRQPGASDPEDDRPGQDEYQEYPVHGAPGRTQEVQQPRPVEKRAARMVKTVQDAARGPEQTGRLHGCDPYHPPPPSPRNAGEGEAADKHGGRLDQRERPAHRAERDKGRPGAEPAHLHAVGQRVKQQALSRAHPARSSRRIVSRARASTCAPPPPGRVTKRIAGTWRRAK